MSRSRGWILGLALAVALTVPLACSQHTDPMEPSGGEVVEIEIRNYEFSQPELHIEPGTTVRWKNTTNTYHTVTPDGHNAWTQWQTASEGQTFEVTFNVAGEYPYYCIPHRSLGMMGTIIVE